MKTFLIALTALAGGVIGGMGLGGGNMIIPALTGFFGVGQKEAQAVCLVSFIPTAAIALFIHAKNGRVDGKNLVYVIIPALVFAAGGGFAAKFSDPAVLRKIFGGFLIATAIAQPIAQKLSEKKAENEPDGKSDCNLHNNDLKLHKKSKPPFSNSK